MNNRFLKTFHFIAGLSSVCFAMAAIADDISSLDSPFQSVVPAYWHGIENRVRTVADVSEQPTKADPLA